MTPPSTTTSPEDAPREAATADEDTPATVPAQRDGVRVPARVIRRAPDEPRPVPAQRSPQPATPSPEPSAPAGLVSDEVPGLYPPQPTGRTEPLAVGALLLGILVPPVGVVVGLAALHRVRRRAANGRGLAVAGVVVGALISAVMILAVVLSALVGLGGAVSDPLTPGGGGGTAGAVSQTCSGSICTVTGRGAPVTLDGIGPGGADGVTVLAIGEGSAAIASAEGPLEVPTGTALELELGTEVVLTQASGDTVVLVYGR